MHVKTCGIVTKRKIRKAVYPKPIAPRRKTLEKCNGAAYAHPSCPVQPSRSGPARSKGGLPSRNRQFRTRNFVFFQNNILYTVFTVIYKGNPCYKILFENTCCARDHFWSQAAEEICSQLASFTYFLPRSSPTGQSCSLVARNIIHWHSGALTDLPETFFVKNVGRKSSAKLFLSDRHTYRGTILVLSSGNLVALAR